MPTAPKLVAAILFFGIGWIAAGFVLDTFPEEIPATYFPLSIGLIGAWQGWMVAGRLAGQGLAVGVGNGIRTSVQLAFFGLAIFALRTMFLRSANLRYDGAGEATVAALELFLEYLLQSLTVPIWATLLVGGVVAGALLEVVARNWR